MPQYRRFYIPGATWFLTVTLAQRRGNDLLVRHVNLLRQAFADTQHHYPFTMEAVVILPEHLHCIWTLPDGEADYSLRWRMLKAQFSRSIATGEFVNASRKMRRERGIWQRRFWVRQILNQEDMNRHIDYIHFNPVKHGWVKRVRDWPYSSFHRYVRAGIYPLDWGGGDLSNIAGDD